MSKSLLACTLLSQNLQDLVIQRRFSDICINSGGAYTRTLWGKHFENRSFQEPYSHRLH